MRERWLLPPAGQSVGRTLLVSTASPAIALGVALFAQPERQLGAVSVFLLAVVVASVVGGIWAGVGSSVLGFLAINYFFTEPLHTLRVHNRDDVVALVVFLVVALLVGWVVSRAVAERDRATRREREARLLNLFTTKALSGEPLDRVLNDLAAALVDALRLASCAIQAIAAGRTYEVRRTRPDAAGGTMVEVPISSGEIAFGTLRASRPPQEELLPEDLRLLESAAGQIAVFLERARLDAEIAAARLDVERSQARAALFSSVTHDLRTPLASIKTAVTSLLQADVRFDAGQVRELLQTVLEETDRLNRLVGNILGLAQVRSGALVPAKEPTALDEVVESVLHRLEPTLGGIRVRTIFRDAPDVPVDPVLIDQVVSNLLENAVRFSPRGGEVAISVAPWRSVVQVRVADQGPGIPPEDRDRVFEAFTQLGAAAPDAAGGSGLGLAISRAIVLAHGGRIWIEGAPGGGAAVVFELPVRDAAPVPQEVAAREGRA
ncbi:MAG TPA: ATP-binding protein [Actinomycetota bacterium]|jgi:two-component system sensor histidine kinase KdpD